jgi:hypothetical protein
MKSEQEVSRQLYTVREWLDNHYTEDLALCHQVLAWVVNDAQVWNEDPILGLPFVEEKKKCGM